MTINVNDNELISLINSKEKVLVDFWAHWCGPCKQIAPILEEISNEIDIKIVKINIDDNVESATRFGIKSIPTMILFENGNIIDTIVGKLSKQDIIKRLK